MGQIGEHPQRIVAGDVVEVKVHDLLVERHGGVEAVLFQEHVRGHHQHLVFKHVAGKGGGEGVQGGPRHVKLALHAQQVGPGIHLHRQRQSVEVEVVGDEQAQVDGVVGNELGGGGLQGIQLALRPIEIAAKVADAGVSEFGLVAQGVVLEIEDDLGEEEGRIPNQPFKHVDVAQGQLARGGHPVVQVVLGKQGLEGFDAFVCALEEEGQEVGTVLHHHRRF